MTEETFIKASDLKAKIDRNRELMRQIEAAHRKNKQDEELNDLLEKLHNATADRVTELRQQFDDLK